MRRFDAKMEGGNLVRIRGQNMRAQFISLTEAATQTGDHDDDDVRGHYTENYTNHCSSVMQIHGENRQRSSSLDQHITQKSMKKITKLNTTKKDIGAHEDAINSGAPEVPPPSEYTFSEAFSYMAGTLFSKDLGGEMPHSVSARVASLAYASFTIFALTLLCATLTASNITDNQQTIKDLSDPR